MFNRDRDELWGPDREIGFRTPEQQGGDTMIECTRPSSNVPPDSPTRRLCLDPRLEDTRVHYLELLHRQDTRPTKVDQIRARIGDGYPDDPSSPPVVDKIIEEINRL
jgi:hypothetical protein